MTPRLVLICHAATDATKRAAFPADEPLHERGLAQATEAGRLVSAPDRSWTSPALRARQTAAAMKLDAHVDNSLRDCDYGRWSGLSLADLQQREPDAVARWLMEPASAPHGGEPILEMQQRVAGWLQERELDAGYAVAITHAAVIRAAIITVLGAPWPAFWCIDVEPLTFTDLRHNGSRWSLRSMGSHSPQH